MNRERRRLLRRAQKQHTPRPRALPEVEVATDDPTAWGALGPRLETARRRPGHRALGFRPVVRLENGLTGYTMDPERPDDCLRPAIATTLQVAVDQVPDPQLDRRLAAGEDPDAISRETWERLDSWLDARGLEGFFHAVVPVDADLWIGVIPGPRTSEEAGHDPDIPLGFTDHCVVCSRDRIVFDPGISMNPPRGYRLAPRRVSDIAYGISFTKTDGR